MADKDALRDIGRVIHEKIRLYLQRYRWKEEPRNAFERLKEEHRLQLAVDIAKSYSNHIYLRR